MRLHLSKLASEDLDSIYQRTRADWGERQALKYVNSLWDTLENICERPDRWRRRDDIFHGCRGCVCGKHLIIYRAVEQVVQVSRILHTSMNLQEHVPTDFLGD